MIIFTVILVSIKTAENPEEARNTLSGSDKNLAKIKYTDYQLLQMATKKCDCKNDPFKTKQNKDIESSTDAKTVDLRSKNNENKSFRLSFKGTLNLKKRFSKNYSTENINKLDKTPFNKNKSRSFCFLPQAIRKESLFDAEADDATYEFRFENNKQFKPQIQKMIDPNEKSKEEDTNIYVGSTYSEPLSSQMFNYRLEADYISPYEQEHEYATLNELENQYAKLDKSELESAAVNKRKNNLMQLNNKKDSLTVPHRHKHCTRNIESLKHLTLITDEFLYDYNYSPYKKLSYCPLYAITKHKTFTNFMYPGVIHLQKKKLDSTFKDAQDRINRVMLDIDLLSRHFKQIVKRRPINYPPEKERIAKKFLQLNVTQKIEVTRDLKILKIFFKYNDIHFYYEFYIGQSQIMSLIHSVVQKVNEIKEVSVFHEVEEVYYENLFDIFLAIFQNAQMSNADGTEILVDIFI